MHSLLATVGLSQIEYAKRLLEELGLPAAGNLVLVADAISADSKKHGVTKFRQARHLLDRVIDPELVKEVVEDDAVGVEGGARVEALGLAKIGR